jgi:hypothetical protein
MGLVACPANHHFQRHPRRFVLALDSLPLEETVPISGKRTHPAFRAIRGDEQGIIQKFQAQNKQEAA